MSAQKPGRIRRAAHFIRTEPGLLRNVVAVVVVVALAFVLAVSIAAIPGESAARIRPADVLRTD